MKILQICKKSPYPAKDGETIAIRNLTTAYYELGHQVDLLAINTPKHYFDIAQYPESEKKIASLTLVDVNTNIQFIFAILNLFTSKSYHYSRFYSPKFEQNLIQILKRSIYDMIQIEGLYMMQYASVIKKYSNATIVFRAHNVEFEIWERYIQNIPFGIKKWYLQLQQKRLIKFEKDIIHIADIVLSITEKDAEVFKKLGLKKPIKTSPVGININNYPLSISKNNNIFFLGALDWLPNIEGLIWFLENVWPLVLSKDVLIQPKLNIAGRNISDSLKKKLQSYKNVYFDGEAVDAVQYIQSKGIMIVPLLSGSGMRVKIIEAMALGKAVITTSIGVEGIQYENDYGILIADTANMFAQKILDLLQDNTKPISIGTAARKKIEMHYNNVKIAKSALDFIMQNN